MKFMKWLLVVSFLLLPSTYLASNNASAEEIDPALSTPQTETTSSETSSTDPVQTDRLDLTMQSAVMLHNGVIYQSAQPVAALNGRTFIPFSSIAARYGYKISYDAVKKESMAKSDQHELVFKIGSEYALRDGVQTKMTGAAYISNGYLMVPLRSWGEMADSTIAVVGKQITLKWSTAVIPPKPTADFEVLPSEIYAGQTVVTYVDHATNATDSPFVDERWEGRMDIFPQAGTYVVTRQVEDSNGVWSDPYSVTVTVIAPNLPPVADFTTDKPQYRIGEPINYTDLSTDDENSIVRSTFTGNEKVFFEPGDKPVTLEVEDKHGMTSVVTKMVTITNDVLYTKDEYDRLFTAPGDIYTVDGTAVLGYPSYKYSILSESSQMVRGNSPEQLIQEGIEYQAQMTGKVRFMFHNVNRIGYPVTVHLLATNMGNSTVNYNKSAIGMGGPTASPELAGKLSTSRYLTSLVSNPIPQGSTIRPGQTVEILPEIAKTPVKPGESLSSYADIYSDKELLYNIVVTAPGKNPVTELPNLTVMPRDGVHVRGTFYNADRTINIDDQIGATPEKVMIGEKGGIDTILNGIDETTGQLEYNLGNFGVLYKMHLSHVAPNTMVSLNARGGLYTGAFLVNGQLVTVANNQALRSNSQAAVLYRTGMTEESVDIVFTIASGSNLPIALMFTPLPALRQ